MDGMDANVSARIENIIATLPTFVSPHNTSPSIDNNPQARSSLFNFHSDFLLINEAIKIRKGLKPTIKVISDCRPTPCFNSAANANRGASAHINQLTLLGF